MNHKFYCFTALLFLVLNVQAQTRTTWHPGGNQKASEGILRGADPDVFSPGFDQLPKDVQASKLAAALKDGTWTYWFANGQVSSVEEYNNGVMTGLWKAFLPNGNKVFEINFLSGAAVYYHPDGSMESEGLMQTGMIQHGTWKGYYANGNLNYVGAFVQGKKDGIWIFYDEAGKKFMEQKFQGGNLLSSRRL